MSSSSLDTSRDGDSPRDKQIWDCGWRRAEGCRSILGTPALCQGLFALCSGSQWRSSCSLSAVPHLPWASSCSCAFLSLLFVLIFSNHLLSYQQEGEEPLNLPRDTNLDTWCSMAPGAEDDHFHTCGLGPSQASWGCRAPGGAEPCVPAGTSLPSPPIAHDTPGACNELFNELSARLSR